MVKLILLIALKVILVQHVYLAIIIKCTIKHTNLLAYNVMQDIKFYFLL